MPEVRRASRPAVEETGREREEGGGDGCGLVLGRIRNGLTSIRRSGLESESTRIVVFYLCIVFSISLLIFKQYQCNILQLAGAKN